jgi:hypothetical protein
LWKEIYLMASLTIEYPKYFEELLVEAAKLKRLPINKETVQIFWNHIKKYSHNQEAITLAVNAVIENGEFLEPGNIIRNIPRTYSEEKDWPTFKDIKASEPIAKDSLKLIFDKMDGKLTKQQYYEGMLALHEKYPKAGFKSAVEQYKKQMNLLPLREKRMG